MSGSVRRTIVISIAVLLVLLVFTGFYQLVYNAPNTTTVGSHMNIIISRNEFQQLIDCRATAKSVIANYSIRGPIPWVYINLETQNEFTLGGQIPYNDYFLFWDTHNFNSFPLDNRKDRTFTWAKDVLQDQLKKAQDGANDLWGGDYYGWQIVESLRNAFAFENIVGKKVLCVGSVFPWIESLALASGASEVWTSEFYITHKIVSEIPDQFRIIDLNQLGNRKFDVIVSVKAIAHAGLGRYMDEISPNADIEMMNTLADHITPNGTFFLGVPLGPDILHWNAHRVYGKIRFPLLTNRFTVKTMFHYREEWENPMRMLTDPRSIEPQPIWVLKPKSSSEQKQ